MRLHFWLHYLSTLISKCNDPKVAIDCLVCVLRVLIVYCLLQLPWLHNSNNSPLHYIYHWCHAWLGWKMEFYWWIIVLNNNVSEKKSWDRETSQNRKIWLFRPIWAVGRNDLPKSVDHDLWGRLDRYATAISAWLCGGRKCHLIRGG